jgi:hypothetical protein
MSHKGTFSVQEKRNDMKYPHADISTKPESLAVSSLLPNLMAIQWLTPTLSAIRYTRSGIVHDAWLGLPSTVDNR